MKKIIFAFIILLTSTICYSQKIYFDIGNTRIKDSTGYTTFNKSVLINYNLYLKGQLLLDSVGKGKIYYDGFDVNWYNKKETGSYIFYIGNQTSKFEIRKYTDESYTSYNPILRVDSNGVNIGINTGVGSYMVDGVPISGSGSTNLYNYPYKDSLNNFLQYNRFKHFTLYGSGSDSVGFFVKGSAGDLMVTPVGPNVTFGSVHGTGTKNVYAGEYYRGTTDLTTYYNTNTTFSNIPYLNKKNTFTALNEFTGVDSSITTKGIKGLTGESYLSLKSPGDGNQRILLYNTTTTASIYIQPSAVSGYSYAFTSSGFTANDAQINWSTSSYGFASDGNTYFQRNSADNVGITTGGTERLNINNSTITSSRPFIVSGTTSYVTFPNLTSTERDALTPSAGMVVFNTTTTKLQVYAGGTWVDLH